MFSSTLLGLKKKEGAGGSRARLTCLQRDCLPWIGSGFWHKSCNLQAVDVLPQVTKPAWKQRLCVLRCALAVGAGTVPTSATGRCKGMGWGDAEDGSQRRF